MNVQQQLLQNLGDEIAKKLAANIPSATGRTAKKIHAVSEPFAVEVLGPSYIFALEYGRGPTKNTTPSNPTLFEAIKEWAMARGIISGESKSELGIVWGITKKIHNEGTKLFRSGVPSGVLTSVIDQINMNSLLKDLTALQINEYSSEVIRELKKLE